MKTNKKNSKNIETVLKVLNAEIRGDVKSALKLLSKDYSMTWVYQGTKELFPNTTNEVQAELEEVYPIKGREYDIKNITESRDVVMVEMIESYPDPETKKIYRTPLVIVLEMKNGKIKTGRHYCDPRISYMHLSREQVKKVFK